MKTNMKFSIICCSHNEEILNNNLLRSANLDDHELLIYNDCSNVPRAYNEAHSDASSDFLMFVHHDVFLPEDFFIDLEKNIQLIQNENWGVLGPAGTTNRNKFAGKISDRGREWPGHGQSTWHSRNNPTEVQTLDELLLVKRNDDFRFDEKIPSSHHLFGSDICLQYAKKSYKNYSLPAYCEHNSGLGKVVPNDWYTSADYIKTKWKDMLPIHATCGVIH